MILILNCGSQSVKWKIFGNDLKLKREGEKEIFSEAKYKKILKEEIKKLAKFESGIEMVGHRIVHGGDEFKEPIFLDSEKIKEIKKYNHLAPLHNPFNILGIETAIKFFPKAKHFAVFDTSFYSQLPEETRYYALDRKVAEKYNIKRFGFHGISHEYATKEAVRITGKSLRKAKIISCHLGGGASITAIKNGKVVDTSMGFTPMEGLIMMTRSGDIDPGIIIELKRHLSIKRINEILNNESGVKGISGEGDMLRLLEKEKKGDKNARLALKMFVYRIRKYIGAYSAVLGGCDLLIFTGSIGFGSSKIRKMISKNLFILEEAKIIPIRPDEELAIARKIKKLK